METLDEKSIYIKELDIAFQIWDIIKKQDRHAWYRILQIVENLKSNRDRAEYETNIKVGSLNRPEMLK